MGRLFFGFALLLFFFAAIGVTIIPQPTAWGLVNLTLGILVGDWRPWRKAP